MNEGQNPPQQPNEGWGTPPPPPPGQSWGAPPPPPPRGQQQWGGQQPPGQQQWGGQQPYGGQQQWGAPPPNQHWQQPGPGWGQQPGHGWGGHPGGEPAGAGARFVARLVDSILVGIVVGIVVFALVFGVVFGSDISAFGTGETGALDFLASVVGAVAVLGYFVFMESSSGQTLGKMMMSIEVKGPDGGRPDVATALKRNLWVLLAIIPGSIGGLLYLAAAISIIVTISSNGNGSGWHDTFAGGTRVVKKS